MAEVKATVYWDAQGSPPGWASESDGPGAAPRDRLGAARGLRRCAGAMMIS